MSRARLLHLTDPHLYGDEAGTLRGVATYPALARTLARARERDWPFDAVLLTGDLVQDDPSGYASIRRAFGDLGRPVYCVPGNHDVPEAMRRELDGPPFVLGGTVDIGAWRIVLLDSTVPGCAGGRLSDRRLGELDAALADAPQKPALVCLHHPPVSMSSRWLDEVGLAHSRELFRVINAHRNVRAVLFGHVHQCFDGLYALEPLEGSRRRQVRLLGTPSTCSQFLPRSDEFAIDPRPPAYRTLELDPDGMLRTEVVWVGASSASTAAA